MLSPVLVVPPRPNKVLIFVLFWITIGRREETADDKSTIPADVAPPAKIPLMVDC